MKYFKILTMALYFYYYQIYYNRMQKRNVNIKRSISNEEENYSCVKSKSEQQLLLRKLEDIELRDYNKEGLTFSLCNACGITRTVKTLDKVSCLDILESHLLLNKILLMGVSETHVGSDKDVTPEVHALYSWVGTPRTSGSSSWGGTGIFVRRCIQYQNITPRFMHYEVECTIITFTYSATSFCYAVIYLPNQREHGLTEISRFLKLMDALLRLDSDVLLVCGDFNAWNTTWGDCDNKRGRLLMEGLVERDLGVKRCAGPTRIGGEKRDTYVDLVISNMCDRISDLTNGFLISDHVIVAGTFLFPEKQRTRRKRVWDFRRTYESGMGKLDSYFDNISWKDKFMDVSIEDIPFVFNRVVLEGWERHGLYKWVASDSRPWFTPVVKTLRRQARFWERQKARAIKGGEPILVGGTLCTLEYCE